MILLLTITLYNYVFLKFSRTKHLFNIPEIQIVAFKFLSPLLNVNDIKKYNTSHYRGLTHEHGPASTLKVQDLRPNGLPLNMLRRETQWYSPWQYIRAAELRKHWLCQLWSYMLQKWNWIRYMLCSYGAGNLLIKRVE